MIPIEPDMRVAVLLAPGERVLAERETVALEPTDAPADATVAGHLYLTSDRLLILGDRRVDLPLADIQEAEVLDRRVLLRMRGASALTIEVDDARALRTEIGTARAGARGERAGQSPR